MREPTTRQPRWPRGTPVAPSGRGPGGGRFRGVGAPTVMTWQELRAAMKAGQLFEVNTRGDDWGIVRMVDETGDMRYWDDRGNGGNLTRDAYRVRPLDFGPAAEDRTTPDWAQRISARLAGGHRFTRGLMSHEQVASYADRTDFEEIGSAGGTYGRVTFRRYSDGTVLAHKVLFLREESEADNEVEASLIARALGVPMPAVVRDPTDRRGVSLLMEYIPEPDWAAEGLFRNRAEGESFDHDTGRLLGLLDVIIGNGDRHGRNVRLAPDGTVVGIDNGLAFGPARYNGMPESTTPLILAASSWYGGKLFRLEQSSGHSLDRRHVQWYFSREAIEEARRRIETVRDQIRPHVWAGIDATLDLLYDMSSSGAWLD